MQRRSFIKGLFLSASAPLIGSVPLITKAADIDFAHVKIYYVNPYQGVSQLVELTDKNDLKRSMRTVVKDGLDWLNSTAYEPYDEHWRYNTVRCIEARLKNYRLDRNLNVYQYNIMADDRNNTPDMVHRNAKNIMVYIQPAIQLGYYVLDFGFDPKYA